VKIAVVSDIHGNLLALDAVVSDLEKQGVDEVWCGGDIGWAGPWAAECISRVREYGWKSVRGNADVWITGDPQTVSNPDQRARFEQIAKEHAIAEEDAQWLLGLPVGYSGVGSMLLVHGTPQSPFVAPQPEAPAAEFAPYEGQAALVIFAHVHRAYVRQLRDGTLVANTGSVGLPMDGEMACYLIVDHSGPEITLVHRRIPYDRRGAIAQSRAEGGAASELFLDLMGVS
jgi:predicted phosphodiesterase